MDDIFQHLLGKMVLSEEMIVQTFFDLELLAAEVASEDVFELCVHLYEVRFRIMESLEFSQTDETAESPVVLFAKSRNVFGNFDFLSTKK